ncbi:elongation factor 4 [Candidatus Gracilibacteria bacterium]|nr:elongation factor 4 [Candidatus Gracilibacteria bacterium]NUJ99053.1 elongation factor 4 [Candidatus Gracilibacteria bacterium]
MNLEHIRNFCIIAHIDHGKSTLADRFLEITGTIDKREMKRGQMLDTMELEQERGITIKLQPVRMQWKGYELNIIDTPGHVDFQYEVSRSLASVEGAILVVDATQGIEAQTLSNVYMAIENDLDIIPIINKIDLPAANVEKVMEEIIHLLGCKKEDIIPVSAKTGENVSSILDAVIERIKMPKVFENALSSGTNVRNDILHFSIHSRTSLEGLTINPKSELKALVFDSQYDTYRGVVSYIKIFSGEVKKGDTLFFINTGKKIEVTEVGYFAPKYQASEKIETGSIGYVVTGLKSIREAKVGDTLWKPADNEGPKDKVENAQAIPGFKKVTPFIFAGIFPINSDEYPQFVDAVEKLMLNDSALTIEPEVSPALGHGYRCGFLGLLHLDIVRERLIREFNMDVIITSPQVTYKVKMIGDKREEYNRFHSELVGETGLRIERPVSQEKVFTFLFISNPEDLPKRELYISMEEPIAKCELITPKEYVGNLMKLAQERRGIFVNQNFLDQERIMLTYELPMSELISDFYDELKSLSSGYASMNYEFLKYREDDLVKLDFLIAGEKVEALSMMCHRTQAQNIGGKITKKLKEVVPKALFAIAIQAAVGGKVVAREDISALRKDVTAKLYGGDISRKRKLLDKQKEGKKKMKQFGKVSLPSEVFINLLKK